MEKVERFYNENGEMAVLFCSDFGGGWSSNCDDFNIAIDRRIIEKFLEGITENEMEKFLISIGYDDVYMHSFKKLKVKWVKKGTRFTIEEYDGLETVKTVDDYDWIIA